MFQKVVFWDNAGFGNSKTFQFRSGKSLNSFLEKYEFTGGIKNFSVDIWSEREFKYEGIQIIPANDEGFKIVMAVLLAKN